MPHTPFYYASGGLISLTLNHLISTLFAPSQRNVVIGPPQVILWSEDPVDYIHASCGEAEC